MHKHSDETRQKMSESLKGKPAWNKGKTLSEKTRKKMSEARKGKKMPPFSIDARKRMSEAHKGKLSPMKGKRHSEESRKKISLAKIGNKNNVGKHWKLSEESKRKLGDSHRGLKSHFWKGGITPINKTIRSSLEYRLWRESVFKRDNWTCIWCGLRSAKGLKIILHADHIKPFALFPELRFAIDNGRTLCINCHRKTNTYAGRVNKIIRYNT